ncbi:MAG: hypothetical protein IJU76_15140 [Desulfovibrionaceae bacterium]|nr:hypothetical protein [Desulfovibrionaceae bacterium]
MSQAEVLPAVNAVNTPEELSFNTTAGFELIQRHAKIFASSSIVPEAFRIGGRPKKDGPANTNEMAIANCSIAVDMALRMQVSPMVIFQQMYIINGRPAFSTAFMIAQFNKTNKYSTIQYEFTGAKGTDDYGCRAVCEELKTRKKLEGPYITIGMAKRDGWYGKPGSKWQTLPELMLRYRAASSMIRLYLPELCMGLHTEEEVRDSEPIQAVATIVRTEEVSVQPQREENTSTSRPHIIDRRRSQAETQSTPQNPVKSHSHLQQASATEPIRQPAQEQAQSSQTKESVQPASTCDSQPQAVQQRQGQESQPGRQPEQCIVQSAPINDTVICPQTNNIRNSRDCGYCRSRQGCPEWDAEI